jgi:hypothetical protein
VRRRRAWIAIGLSAFAAVPATAQTVVTFARPESVDVTVYRNPQRNPGAAFRLQWLGGYALISETRTISLPAGGSEIRFEGVAGGILPQSAIIAGFPDGIVERNRDAYLLSPESLLDRSLGRRVHLRRTSTATGAVREQDAVIRSGADGAVVLQTAEGFEALRCTGLRETLVYDGVPAGLSAQPTLSVRARASRPVTATVTLAYLADGFDWQANYIAELSPDGNHVDLFAWLTLASNDETSFVDADTQAVAGRLNREQTEREAPEANALTLRCWPQGRTSDVAQERVVVTGSRIRLAATRGATAEDNLNELPALQVAAGMMARQEELGDLKLYRIPEPVTVAANSQKQIAFLQRAGVQVEFVHRQHLHATYEVLDDMPPQRVLVTRNRDAEGLGLPLPGGRLVLFADAGDRPVLLGEGEMGDRAIGEDVEVELGPSVGVTSAVVLVSERNGRRQWEMEVSNDSTRPVRFEADFSDFANLRTERRLARRNGRPLWRVDIPANGRATLRFRDLAPSRSE